MVTADERAIRKMWEVNYFSVFLFIQEVLPYLKKNDEASILIMSTGAVYYYKENYGHYILTKVGLTALVKHCSRELQEAGIRVNGISPGLIKTPFSRRVW